MQTAPQPVFEQPWHAQLFALSVALNAQGLFSWPDWTKRFGARLKHNGADHELNGGDDYFTAWISLPGWKRSKRCWLSAIQRTSAFYLTCTPHGPRPI